MECKTTWIQCSKTLCGKWRVIRDEIAAKFADIPWTCDMNENTQYNKCTVPEEKVDVPRGKKIVVTKFPYEKGEIIMAKMAGYCLWPAFISPDPNCDEYYDAVLNDKDEQEEFTHIHVEFFGRPRTHAWITVDNAFPFTVSKKTTVKSTWGRSYDAAMEEALKSLPLSCEERLQKCTFRFRGCQANSTKEDKTNRISRCSKSENKTNVTNDETSFLQEFYNFKIENGVEVEKIKSPVWCGKKIDLYKIFETVKNHGGYTEACKRHLWLTLRKHLLGKDSDINKSSGTLLKQFYERHMLDFEQYQEIKNGKETPIPHYGRKEYQQPSNISLLHQQSSPAAFPIVIQKKRGRPKKSTLIESTIPDVVFTDISSVSCNAKFTEEITSQLQQRPNEDVTSTRKGRKRKSKMRSESSRTTSICHSKLASTDTRRNLDVSEENQNVSPFHGVFEKPTLDKKLTRRNSKKIESPFLASRTSGTNSNIPDEQGIAKEVQSFPMVRDAGESPQAISNDTEALVQETSIPALTRDELSLKDSSKCGRQKTKDMIIVSENVNEKAVLPIITETFRMAHSASHVLGESTTLSSSLSNPDVTNNTRACTNSVEPDQNLFPSPSTTAEYKTDFLSDVCPSPAYEPEDFAVAYKHYIQANTKITGYEYVPSSNPNSPQAVPTEEDLEEDCRISIERELKEIERVLYDCADLKGFPGMNKTRSLTRSKEHKKTADRMLLADAAVQEAIQTMLKLEDDISQLEGSMELDFL